MLFHNKCKNNKFYADALGKNYLKYLVITIIVSQLFINTQYVESHYIGQPQPIIGDLIRDLNEEEIIMFNEELRVDPQQLFRAVEAANPEVDNEQILEPSQKYHALILFVLGTFTLFIISQYGSTIIECSFNFIYEIPGAIHRSITSIIRMAAESNRLDTSRFTMELMTEEIKCRSQDTQRISYMATRGAFGLPTNKPLIDTDIIIN